MEIDRDIGAVLVNCTELHKVPPPIDRLLLKALLSYTSGHPVVSITAARTVSVLAALKRGIKGAMTQCGCYIQHHHHTDNTLIIIRARQQRKVPIVVGQPLLWENRFLVSLTSSSGSDSRTYYVDFFGNVFRNGHPYSGHSNLPSHLLKLIPVILNAENKLVAIPHLDLTDPSHNLFCSITHKTLYSLDEFIR